MDARINGFYEEASELSEEITENDIEDLQELQEMVEMVNWKKKQTIKSLRKAADKLDQVCRDCKVAHAIGTTGGVVSGVISTCATVGTGGAVAPLLLATGMGLGLGGAAINLGTSYIEAASNSAEVKNAEKLLKETSDCVKKVNALIRHWLKTKEMARLAYICCLATQLKLDPFVINFLYEVSSFCLRPFSKVTEKSAGTVVPAKNAFSLTESTAPAKFIEVGAQVVDDVAQERIKLRERIPHIGPIPIVIPLKLFYNVQVFLRIIFPRALRGSFVEGKSAKHKSGVRELR